MLHRTNQAMTELAANSPYGAGVHFADHVRAGADGLVIGETELNYALHDPGDVMHDSIMAEVTGLDYVPITIPQHPVHVNMVVDRNVDRGDSPEIAEAKTWAIDRVQAEIRDSRPDGNDTVSLFYIDGEGLFRPTEGEEPITSPEDLLEICGRGLTFVVSDFNRLGSAAFTGQTLDRPVVGVRVNHAAELGVPPGKGTIDVGGGAELNTDNPEQLAAFNDALAEYHSGVDAELARAGLLVARIAVQPWVPGGLDMPQVDEAIAAQVKRLR